MGLNAEANGVNRDTEYVRCVTGTVRRKFQRRRWLWQREREEVVIVVDYPAATRSAYCRNPLSELHRKAKTHRSYAAAMEMSRKRLFVSPWMWLIDIFLPPSLLFTACGDPS